VIRCEPRSLMRGQPWYVVPDSVLHYTIEVGEPIVPADFAAEGEPRGAAARRITATLRDFYAKRLHNPNG
jgi:hypothetical protein